MLSAGIVAEYNPFHSGHAFLMESLRRQGATHIIAVMSGNYVQRGDASLLSKWARTEQALACGVDLVAELPLPWSLAGAERFATGGVFLLNELGADVIGFGSECGSIEKLKTASEAIESPLLRKKLKEELSGGATFARARQRAAQSLFGEETALLLRSPNNILGIEYLKALRLLQSRMIPFTVKRAGVSHDSPDSKGYYASSSMIRSLLRAGDKLPEVIPEPAQKILKREIEQGRAPADLTYVERAVLAKLRTMERRGFSSLPDISEGLENRIFAAVRKATELEGLHSLIKTKRYTHARIRRAILSAFLGLKASDCAGYPPYIRILGMRPGGAQILRAAKGTTKLPILTRFADTASLDGNGKKISRLESTADDLYALCQPKISPCGTGCNTGLIHMGF